MSAINQFIQGLGLDHPATYLLLFLASSLLMIWRLEAMGRQGLEGTALGTLITPYCSGFGNLVFVYLVLRDHGDGRDVMTNCLVNNVTNLTLVLGLPAIFWAVRIGPAPAAKPPKKNRSSGKVETERRLSRLSLLLTLLAVLFFTGVVWSLGLDGKLEASDGVVLVALFLFWQALQLVDVLKHNVRTKRSFGFAFYLDLLFVLAGSLLLYVSLEWLVHWLGAQKTGFISSAHLGWLSGWLMVLPNAILAFYYAARGRGDIVYASQIGDGHICIPLCVGLYALAKPLVIPALFNSSILLLGLSLAVHFFCVLGLGRLPRAVGIGLVAAYLYFCYTGLVG